MTFSNLTDLQHVKVSTKSDIPVEYWANFARLAHTVRCASVIDDSTCVVSTLPKEVMAIGGALSGPVRILVKDYLIQAPDVVQGYTVSKCTVRSGSSVKQVNHYAAADRLIVRAKEVTKPTFWERLLAKRGRSKEILTDEGYWKICKGPNLIEHGDSVHWQMVVDFIYTWTKNANDKYATLLLDRKNETLEKAVEVPKMSFTVTTKQEWWS